MNLTQKKRTFFSLLPPFRNVIEVAWSNLSINHIFFIHSTPKCVNQYFLTVCLTLPRMKMDSFVSNTKNVKTNIWYEMSSRRSQQIFVNFIMLFTWICRSHTPLFSVGYNDFFLVFINSCFVFSLSWRHFFFISCVSPSSRKQAIILDYVRRIFRLTM